MKISLYVSIGLLVIALSCSAQQNSPAPTPTGRREVMVNKMGRIASDLLSLIKASDLIVDGTVDKVLSTVRSDQKPVDLKTYTRISVNKVIRGKIHEDQKSLAIAELGGSLAGYEVVYNNNPLLQSGDHYILFLTPFHEQKGYVEPDFGIPIYSIVEEFRGKAKISKQGTIESFPVESKRSGMDLEAFLALMTRAAAIIDRIPPTTFPQNGSNPPDNYRPSFMIPSQK